MLMKSTLMIKVLRIFVWKQIEDDYFLHWKKNK